MYKQLRILLRLSSLLISAFPGHAQVLDIIPAFEIGRVNYYHNIDVVLADTGAIGSSQTWDFSNHNYDAQVWESVQRDLDASELISFPDANLAIESNGTIDYCYQSPDSIVQVGGYSPASAIETSYTNFQTLFDSTIQYNTVYTDSFSYNYYSGTVLVTVEGISTWVASAQGELQTPTMIYPNTYKVTRTSNMQFYAQGGLVQEVNAINTQWLDENHSSVLMEVSHDDYNNTTNGRFLRNESFASLQKHESSNNFAYPNPNNGVFNILFDDHHNEQTTLTVIDATGSIVLEEQFDELPASREKELDLSAYESGTYTVITRSGDHKKSQRVIIQ